MTMRLSTAADASPLLLLLLLLATLSSIDAQNSTNGTSTGSGGGGGNNNNNDSGDNQSIIDLTPITDGINNFFTDNKYYLIIAGSTLAALCGCFCLACCVQFVIQNFRPPVQRFRYDPLPQSVPAHIQHHTTAAPVTTGLGSPSTSEMATLPSAPTKTEFGARYTSINTLEPKDD